jgi:hypothetical protein
MPILLAFALGATYGCATIPADKVIEAATKCIQDATTVLASEAERLETHRAIEQLQATEELARKSCPGQPSPPAAAPPEVPKRVQ